MTLVDQIDQGGTDEGLRRFNDERVGFGRKIVVHAWHLGACMQAQLQTELQREMAERHRTPVAVMTQTAVAPEFALH